MFFGGDSHLRVAASFFRLHRHHLSLAVFDWPDSFASFHSSSPQRRIPGNSIFIRPSALPSRWRFMSAMDAGPW